MIKLYICYFVFGGLMLNYSLTASFWPPEGMATITKVALCASIGLYLIIPALVWYRLKFASIAGLVLTACVMPFSGYWLWCRFVQREIIIGGPNDLTIYIMAALLIMIIVYSIKYAVNANLQIGRINIRKPVKVILASLPATLALIEYMMLLFGKG